MPMLRWASIVLPPTWGVRMQLSNSRRGETNSSSLDFGSTGKTSIAAPARRFSRRAAARASMSTTVPREALMNIALGCIQPSSLAPIMFLVSGVSGTCRVTMSQVLMSSFSELTCVALPRGSLVTTSYKYTFMPIDSASTLSCEPILP